MPYCRKCGALNDEDAKFCAKCGTAVAPAGTPADQFARKVSEGAQDFAKRMQQEADRVSEGVRGEDKWRLGRAPPEVARNDALLGSLSAGAVLIVIALAFLRYPGSLAALGDYFNSLGESGAFIRPPAILLRAGAFFLAAVGLWSFVLAVLRLLVQRSGGRALHDFVGGVFAFYLAFLVSSYAALRIGGMGLIALAVVGLGVLIIVQGLVRALMPSPPL
jgi:hypothetical protein